MILKAYDTRGKLYVSKDLKTQNQLEIAFCELTRHTEINAVWLKNGKVSKRLPYQKQTRVDKRYIGSDGIVTGTIPIRLSAYPCTVIDQLGNVEIWPRLCQ